MRMLVVSPRFTGDTVTETMSPWGYEFARSAEAKGHTVGLLNGPLIERATLEGNLRAGKYDFFVWFDHGASPLHMEQGGGALPGSTIMTREDELEVKTWCLDLKNCDCLRGVHAYAMACFATFGVGPKAVEQGCLSYSGFKLPGILMPAAPVPFKEQAFLYPNAIVDGKSLGEAWEAYDKTWDVVKGALPTIWPPGVPTAMALTWNYLIFTQILPAEEKTHNPLPFTASDRRRAVAQIEGIKGTMRTQLVRFTAEEKRKPFISFGARTLTLEEFLAELGKGLGTALYEALVAGLVELYKRGIL